MSSYTSTQDLRRLFPPTQENDLVKYYSGLDSDELIRLYKGGEITEYIANIIAEILEDRNIDTLKIKKVLIKTPRKPWKDAVLDAIGHIGFLFGIIAPIMCALLETYIWATKGHWPGYSSLDLLHFLNITQQPSSHFFIYFEDWQGLSNIANHVIGFILNLSLILFLGLIGFVIFELVDMLHNIINKKKYKPSN